ncbi:MAG: CoA-binding protein, partial [Desulfohalobiaceae bacterium]|nr:CoA-binding protein [Desulfohalobiaceae bacterium]
MSTHHLDHLFNPGSVAVIGASEQEGSIGSVLMQNMIQAGFQGRIHPVNPKYGSIHGFTARASILDLEEAPDLAVIAIPIQTVPDIIEDCVQAGTKGAVIISAGGREAGPEGVKLEERIKARADQTGLRIIGPNCLGIIAPGNKLNASFAAHMPDKGRLAFISQSGAICTSMLDLSLKENMGFRYFISIGSMLDVDFGDLIDYVGSDSGVESILLYIESLTQVRKFMSAARGISRLKPIVIIKSGKSAAGARAASSHTGALAGEDSVYDVAFRRTGAVRVRTIGDFFRCAELLAKGPRARGPRLTVLTNSGGPGVMAVDAINEYGLETAELSRETLDNLNRVLPEHWSRANPVDILGDASAERYVQAVNTLENTETDGLLVILNPQAMTDPGQVARDLSPVLSGKPFPVLTSWMGGRYVEKGIEIFNQAGISTFDTPEQAVRSFKYLHDYTRNLKKLTEIPPRVPERLHFDRDAAQSMLQTGLSRKDGLLTEIEAKDVIRAYGIPGNRTESAASEDEAVRL